MAEHDAPGLVLSPTARVGHDVRFGAHVVVHDGVVIGDGVTIQDGAILGKRPALAPGSSTAGAIDDPLLIGDGASICAQAIVFAGATIGAGTIVGDQSYVRERARIGAGTVIGRGCCVDNDVAIGDHVRLQTGVYLTAYSVVEDDVFIGPCAMTTNDNTMGRHRGTPELAGATLRRGCRVGGAVVITPGVEIGEEAFIAAGAVVTNDVAARTVVMGVPAHAVRRVADDDLLENFR